MKVLFLDFDGVLSPFGKLSRFDHEAPGAKFSKVCCENMQSLLDKVPELKVVVSSAWRRMGLEGVKGVLKNNNIDSSRVIDITGNENGDRGYQVQCWLDRNPGVETYVVFDDESDFPTMLNKLVKTNSFIGVTSKQIELAVEILNKTK